MEENTPSGSIEKELLYDGKLSAEKRRFYAMHGGLARGWEAGCDDLVEFAI